MIRALKAFDKVRHHMGPIRTEAEDAEARAYWVPLHALYSEVNRRLDYVSRTVQELGRTFLLAYEGGIKNQMAKDIAAIYKKRSGTHKTYARYLPALHGEVKRTMERVREWAEDDGED